MSNVRNYSLSDDNIVISIFVTCSLYKYKLKWFCISVDSEKWSDARGDKRHYYCASFVHDSYAGMSQPN